MVNEDSSTVKRWVYLLPAVALLFVYLLAGFYPFQLKTVSSGRLDNGVIATPDQVLHFPAPGIAYTDQAPPWLPQAIATSSLELSLEVRAADQQQDGPARIFTLSLNPQQRNLTVGQRGPNLSVRMRNPYTNQNGRPDYIVSGVFSNPSWHRIDVRITEKALEIRVDGDTLATAPLQDHPLETWDPGYRLALGNELTGDRPWRGSIRKAIVRIDTESFNYLAPDALNVPETFTPSVEKDRRGGLVPFINAQYNKTYLVDWTINLLGFVPFGWLLVMSRRPRPGILIATILSAGVSATIETSQMFLVDRFPSTGDLLLNTLGGALGAWLAERYEFSIRKRPTPVS